MIFRQFITSNAEFLGILIPPSNVDQKMHCELKHILLKSNTILQVIKFRSSCANVLPLNIYHILGYSNIIIVISVFRCDINYLQFLYKILYVWVQRQCPTTQTSLTSDSSFWYHVSSSMSSCSFFFQITIALD